jgi:endonuclease/exonuclease/phosphatase family metal-dependent hydrolase
MITVVGLNAANYDDHDSPGDEPGPWVERLPAIANAIVAGNPDVIGLCEIRFNANNPFNSDCGRFWGQYGVNAPNCGLMDMGAQILLLLQTLAPEAYGPATIMTSLGPPYPNGAIEGLSIITRWPVRASGDITHGKTPGSSDAGNTRLTQWAVINTPADGPLGFFNTHLSLDANDRVLQVQEILQLIAAKAPPSYCLVGDMNAEPTDPAMQALAAAGLTDTWPQLQGTSPGFTFQSWALTKRIDYCWTSPALAPAAQSMTLFGQPASPGATCPSDHLGTLTTFA